MNGNKLIGVNYVNDFENVARCLSKKYSIRKS